MTRLLLRLAAFALGLSIALPAHAGGVVAATVTTSSSQMLAAATTVPRRLILIQNAAASGGNNIACTLSGTAALNTAGSLQLVPGQVITLAAYGAVFWDAVNCIAATGSTPATIIWDRLSCRFQPRRKA